MPKRGRICPSLVKLGPGGAIECHFELRLGARFGRLSSKAMQESPSLQTDSVPRPDLPRRRGGFPRRRLADMFGGRCGNHCWSDQGWVRGGSEGSIPGRCGGSVLGPSSPGRSGVEAGASRERRWAARGSGVDLKIESCCAAHPGALPGRSGVERWADAGSMALLRADLVCVCGVASGSIPGRPRVGLGWIWGRLGWSSGRSRVRSGGDLGRF